MLNFTRLTTKATAKSVFQGFRKLATVSSPLRTRTTILPNGLTVATESIPFSETATVGVWIDAGSRAENAKNNGTAHFLEHLAFKGTSNRSQYDLEIEIENLGAHLNAYTSRESTVYYAKAFKNDVPKAVDILSDILQRSALKDRSIERERDVIIRESEEVDKLYDEVVFDHLHAAAFQDQALGRTILGPRENILSIKQNDLKSYITKNYTADRMVLVGAGAIDHEEFVKLAEAQFSGLPLSEKPVPLGSPRGASPKFIGSEVRLTDDSLPVAYIAIAVEGVSWGSEDYFTALIAQALVGNWDRTLGGGSLNGPGLMNAVASNNLANSYMSFSTSYSDSGLWGIFLTTENVPGQGDLVKYCLEEWRKLSQDVDPAAVERAKAQLKASLLLTLDGTTPIAEDIGRQIVTTGHRLSPEEVFDKVDKITSEDVVKWAKKTLYNKDITITGLGPIQGLPDYSSIRSMMA